LSVALCRLGTIIGIDPGFVLPGRSHS
jgi:hypothetical protein